MANTNKVNGFTPVKMTSGAPWNGQAMPCAKAAGTTVTNDMFVGDMVVLAGSADADGLPTVTVATAGTNPILGCVVGIKYDPDNLDRSTWIDGAGTGVVMVATGKDVVYEAQADEALAVTNVAKNVNIVDTAAGDRDAGTSGKEVDATVTDGATAQLKLIGFVNNEENVINALYNRVLVVINNHQLGTHTGTAGL